MAAGNGDGAAAVGVVVEEVAAADACATIIARSCNVAAGNGDGAAVAAPAAADACGIHATFGLNVAAGNIDDAAVAAVAAADACGIIAAIGCNLAAGNGDVAAVAAVAAADACAAVSAGGFNVAAVNGDGAALLILVAADACLISRALGNQRTHPLPLGLGIDAEAVVFGNMDALRGIEGGTVGKDQVQGVGDFDTVFDYHIFARHHIPAGAEGNVAPAFKLLGNGFFLFSVFVQIGNFKSIAFCASICRSLCWEGMRFLTRIAATASCSVLIFVNGVSKGVGMCANGNLLINGIHVIPNGKQVFIFSSSSREIGAVLPQGVS